MSAIDFDFGSWLSHFLVHAPITYPFIIHTAEYIAFQAMHMFENLFLNSVNVSAGTRKHIMVWCIKASQRDHDLTFLITPLFFFHSFN